MLLKKLPYHDRPREKAIKYGFSKISNSELLSILIRSGTKGRSAIEVSYDILNKLGGISGLMHTNIQELCTIKGIEQVKAIQLLAAIELSKRINDVIEVNKKISNGYDVYSLVGDYLKNEVQEHFIIILLDVKSNLINYQTLYKGGLNQNIIHMRDIFREVVRYNAYKFICVHNHPTGDPLPSDSDIYTTNEIIKSSKLMGIRFEDHIIIGFNKYYSFKESKLLLDQK